MTRSAEDRDNQPGVSDHPAHPRGSLEVRAAPWRPTQQHPRMLLGLDLQRPQHRSTTVAPRAAPVPAVRAGSRKFTLLRKKTMLTAWFSSGKRQCSVIPGRPGRADPIQPSHPSRAAQLSRASRAEGAAPEPGWAGRAVRPESGPDLRSWRGCANPRRGPARGASAHHYPTGRADAGPLTLIALLPVTDVPPGAWRATSGSMGRQNKVTARRAIDSPLTNLIANLVAFDTRSSWLARPPQITVVTPGRPQRVDSSTRWAEYGHRATRYELG
jgi:hypothetical protein